MTQMNRIEVKCPVCDAQVSVTSSSGGERVKCDRCGASIKVPAVERAADNDEDWLSLADDIEPQSHRRPPETDVEEVDEFQIPDLEDLPSSPGISPPAAAPPLSDADLEVLGGFFEDDDQKPVPMKPVPAKPAADNAFGVRCKVCDSLNYARPAQVGQRIRCHDCHSPIVVPPPPKAKVKYQPDMETAAAYTFQEAEETAARRDYDPFRKSADDYLRAAEEANEPEEEEWDLPDLGQWLGGILSIFRDPAVTIHAAVLSMLAFIPAAIAIEYESSVIVMGMFAAGAIFAALVIACGFAILQSVANGETRVSEWPIFDPMEWIGQLILALFAVGIAAGPAWLFGFYVFGGGLISVALAMMSLYIFFPIVVLSMLDEQSIFTPFSADVTKSMTRAPDQWGAAYLCSAILFFGIFLIFMTSTVIPAKFGALLAIFTTVCGVFTYFGIVGRLAYGIGHAINAPPMQNDIEDIRSRESRQSIGDEEHS